MKTIFAVAVLVATQLSQVSVFEGDWRTDLPANFRMSSIVAVMSEMNFAVTADTVKVTLRYVSPGGGSFSSDEIYQTDGLPHAAKDGPGWTYVAMWLNPALLDVMKTGRGTRVVTVHSTFSVSADRQTLTQRHVYSSNGYIDERIFRRSLSPRS